jgi:hypothetical protein
MLQTTQTFWTNSIFQQKQKNDIFKLTKSHLFWCMNRFYNLQQNIEIPDSHLFAVDFQRKLKSIVMYETVYVEISERPTSYI